MRGRPKTARLEALKEVLRAQAASTAEIHRCERVAANVLTDRAVDEAELDDVLARSKNVVAAAMLEGKTASPDPVDIASAARLQERIGAAETAHAAALRHAETARHDAKPIGSAVAAATIAYCNELRADALATARETLAQLAQPLADLTAADGLQHRLIGETFKADAKAEPFFAGRPLALSIVAKIPDRLRPEDLFQEKFRELVAAKTAERIGVFKEILNDDA